MAKGEKLTTEVLENIRRACDANPDLKAVAIAVEVRRKLGKEKSKNYTWPADVTVRTQIRKMKERRHAIEASGEDEPWQMSTLKQYPHTAGEIAAIMAAYRFAYLHNVTLTIRQAKWVARLSETIKMIWARREPTERELVAHTIIEAVGYARAELTSELLGTPLDTFGLDYHLATALDKQALFSGNEFVRDAFYKDWPPHLKVEDYEEAAVDQLKRPESYLAHIRAESATREPMPAVTRRRIERYQSEKGTLAKLADQTPESPPAPKIDEAPSKGKPSKKTDKNSRSTMEGK